MPQDKYTLMTTAPVPRLIRGLAVPTIISMLVTSFYVMADTYFVGKINTQSTAAVGISFSIMAIIQAFGFFCGHGSGNFISRRLGARDYHSAEKMAATPKRLFATLRHFSELQKALKNGDHHRAGHPSRISRTHPSAPLTKGSRSFGWPRNRRISCGGFVVSKKSFRHDETFFRASKSSEK